MYNTGILHMYHRCLRYMFNAPTNTTNVFHVHAYHTCKIIHMHIKRELARCASQYRMTIANQSKAYRDDFFRGELSINQVIL